MNKILAGIAIGALLAVGGIVLMGAHTAPHNNLGLFLTSRVTNTSSSIGGATSGATTTIWAAGANLQHVVLTDLGQGNIYCAFGVATATLQTGLHLNSSTDIRQDITDPNLLGKLANCIADVTSTLGIMKY